MEVASHTKYFSRFFFESQPLSLLIFMVSLKCSGREIPALINHLQIILVQTLSVQIDNGYLIQKKCLVSQKFYVECAKIVKTKTPQKTHKETKPQQTKNTSKQPKQPFLLFLNFSFAVICFSSCRSWQQNKPHNGCLICGFVIQTTFRKLNLCLYRETFGKLRNTRAL